MALLTLGQQEFNFFFFKNTITFLGESDGGNFFCAKCNVCKKIFAKFLQIILHKNFFLQSCSKLKINRGCGKKIKIPMVPSLQNGIFAQRIPTSIWREENWDSPAGPVNIIITICIYSHHPLQTTPPASPAHYQPGLAPVCSNILRPHMILYLSCIVIVWELS